MDTEGKHTNVFQKYWYLIHTIDAAREDLLESWHGERRDYSQ